jgi:poly(beta-D-mannuronate) lyase
VKLLGFGRFNDAGDSRTSIWTAVGEIEFFGDLVLSVDDFEFNKNALVYPVPAKDNLYIKVLKSNIESMKLIVIEGRLLLEKTVEISNLEFSIDISTIPSGTYILNLSNSSDLNNSRMLIISH